MDVVGICLFDGKKFASCQKRRAISKDIPISTHFKETMNVVIIQNFLFWCHIIY